MGEPRDIYRILLGKSEVKRPLGRPRRRWEDNFNVGLQEGNGLDRSSSGQGQVAGTCECSKELSGSIKCGKVLE
jgi:hypothetical protein